VLVNAQGNAIFRRTVLATRIDLHEDIESALRVQTTECFVESACECERVDRFDHVEGLTRDLQQLFDFV